MFALKPHLPDKLMLRALFFAILISSMDCGTGHSEVITAIPPLPPLSHIQLLTHGVLSGFFENGCYSPWYCRVIFGIFIPVSFVRCCRFVQYWSWISGEDNPDMRIFSSPPPLGLGCLFGGVAGTSFSSAMEGFFSFARLRSIVFCSYPHPFMFFMSTKRKRPTFDNYTR